MRHWLDQGCPREKLVLGIPTYGRSFSLSSDAIAVGSPASGPGTKGPFTNEPGFLAYYEICKQVNTNTLIPVTDPTGKMGPVAHGGGQWVGYDDPAMAAVKADYVVEMGLGGAMFWDLPSDDFNNRQFYSFSPFDCTMYMQVWQRLLSNRQSSFDYRKRQHGLQGNIGKEWSVNNSNSKPNNTKSKFKWHRENNTKSKSNNTTSKWHRENRNCE